MLDFLPKKIKNSIQNLNTKYLYELRLRALKPTLINYAGEFQYLGERGITNIADKAIYCSIEDIEDCIYRAGNYSVYSIEEEIRKGFITAKTGERLGLAGEYVFDNGKVLAIRNFTSICIRVPHEIEGCSQTIYNCCMSDRVHNLLLMSPPGLGKTTILRDLSRMISEKKGLNILICDERGEISVGNTGKTSDVIKFANKESGFEAGIRAMRPDIIITDELSERDYFALQKANVAGVSVIASAHFLDIKHLPKSFLEIFSRFVLLNEKKIGEIRAIYDNSGNILFCND